MTGYGGPQLPGQGNQSNRLRNTLNNQQSKTRSAIGGNAAAALPPLDPASTANYYSQIQGLYSQYRQSLSALKAQRVGLRAGFRETRAGIRRDLQLGIADAEGQAIGMGMLGSSQDLEQRINIRANAAQQIAQARNEMRSGIADTRLAQQKAATDYFMGVTGVQSAALAQQQSQLADDLMNNLITSGAEQNANILKSIYESLSPGGNGNLPFRAPGGAGPIGARLINFAYSQQGAPYVFGAMNPEGPKGGKGAAFDCSGFTSWAVSQATGGKLQLPHSAAAQSDVLPKLSRNELRPGDLLFFGYGSGRYGRAIDHVAIYLGNGRMIDTSSPSRPLGIRAVDWDNFIQGGRTPHGKRKPQAAGGGGQFGSAGGQQ